MSTIDLSQKIVGANASYQAGPWASMGAAAGVEFRASGQLKRGIDLQLGIEAMAALDASFRKFLSAQGHAYATASAGVQAQIQLPLDLFDEAGAALRLQAAAQAAAGIRLSLGLSIGDFIALAQADPRMTGLPIKLLRIFLEELVVEGGFMAKVAVAAMAYAKFSLTGALIERGAQKPGFTVAGEFGAGFKAGMGIQVFANFGVADPRRLIRRSVDVTVDETVSQLRPLLQDPTQQVILSTLRAPAKMALRTGFELGLELAQDGGAFDASNGPRLAQRCVQVMLEEAQRFLLERIVHYAMDAFDQHMAALSVSQADWDRTSAARARLAALLGRLPAEPFEITYENRSYWADVASASIDLVQDVTQTPAPPAHLLDALSALWVAGELMFVSVERISKAQARVVLIGLPPLQTSAAFTGAFSGPEPPKVIRNHINTVANRAPATPMTLDTMVEFIVRDTLLDGMRQRFPDVDPVLDIIAGPQGIGLTAAAKSIFGNIGAFAPGPNGTPDPAASLRVFADGLRAYIDARVMGELVPWINAVTGDRPELRLYVEEVFVPTLHFTVGVVFERVMNWSTGDLTAQAALREACSSIVMKLFGRSLVVTADVIVAAAQGQVHEELMKAAGQVNDPGGLAQFLAPTVPLDRAAVAELLEETLHIAADVLGPLPQETRHKVRALLYEAVDTLPANPDADFLEELRHSFFVPNLDTATALAGELGQIMARNMEEFVARVLQRVAELVLAELRELIEQAAAEIAAWIEAMEDLARALLDRLVALAAEIQALLQNLEERWNRALDELDRLLRLVGHGSNRQAVRHALRSAVLEEAKAALSTNFFYASLPQPGRAVVERGLSAAVYAALDSALFDAIWDALGNIAVDAADLIEDVRGLDPQQDIAAAVLTLFLDRVENRVRSVLGYANPKIRLRFHVKENYTPIAYVFGQRVELPPVQIDFTFDLGSVSLPLNHLINTLRIAIAGIGSAEQLARTVAEHILAALTAELALATAEVEQAQVEKQNLAVRDQLADTQEREFTVAVLAPAPGSYHEHDVECIVALSDVPRSFLGRGYGEQQRVFVWLNEAPLHAGRFTVEEAGGDANPPREAVRGIPAAEIIRGRRGYLNQAQTDCGKMTGSVRKRTAQPRPDAGRADRERPPAEELRGADELLSDVLGCSRVVERRMSDNRRNAASDSFYVPGLSSARGSETEAARARLLGSGTTQETVGRQDPPSRLSAHSLRWGRSLNRSDLLKLVAAAEPDLLLKFDLSLPELEEGINTLTVAVVDGRGNRVAQSVSFIAGQPGRAKDPLVLSMLGELKWGTMDSRIIGEKATTALKPQNDYLSEPPLPPDEPRRGPMKIGSKQVHWIRPRAEREKMRREGWEVTQRELRSSAATVRALGSAVRETGLRPEMAGGTKPPREEGADDPLQKYKVTRKPPTDHPGGSSNER